MGKISRTEAEVDGRQRKTGGQGGLPGIWGRGLPAGQPVTHPFPGQRARCVQPSLGSIPTALMMLTLLSPHCLCPVALALLSQPLHGWWLCLATLLALFSAKIPCPLGSLWDPHAGLPTAWAPSSQVLNLYPQCLGQGLAHSTCLVNG